MEARGFIGSAAAYRLKCGLRAHPQAQEAARAHCVDLYELEYGKNTRLDRPRTPHHPAASA